MKSSELPHIKQHLYDPPMKINYNSIYQRYMKSVRETLQKHNMVNHYDYSDTIVNRRLEAIDSWRDRIIERYKTLPSFFDPYINISIFTKINLNLFGSVNIVEYHHFILLAAALWYLDRVTVMDDWRDKIAPFLPTDETVLDSVVIPELWHPRYDADLIRAVVYVFTKRYGDKPEKDGGNDGVERIILNSENARGRCLSNPPATENYKNFIGLVSLIPQSDVQVLMDIHEETALKWLDRLYRCLSSYAVKMQRHITEVNKASDGYESTVAEMEKLRKAFPRCPKQTVKKQAPNPLLVNPPNVNDPLVQQPFQYVVSRNALYDTRTPEGQMLSLAEKAYGFHDKDKEAFEAFNDCVSSMSQLICDIGKQGFITDCSEYGDEVESQMAPLDITNPYALCFAFLMLVENGRDFSWLCGVNVGFLNEIATRFPWSAEPYHAIRDDFWPILSKRRSCRMEI